MYSLPAYYVLKLHYQTDYSALFVDGAEALDKVLVDFIRGDDFTRRWYARLEHTLVSTYKREPALIALLKSVQKNY